MSNSRIFCWAFVSFIFTDFAIIMAGVKPVYNGIDGLIAKFIVGSVISMSAVAMLGDRKKTPE